MSKWEDLELQSFLALNPKMRLTHFGNEAIIIEGEYDIGAQMEGFNQIHDTYALKVSFSKEYPRAIPTVIETENRIPKDPKYHTYSDGSFCLGSEINLKAILFDTPNVSDFIEKIVAPFLYSISYKLKYDEYPNGELEHGESGLIDDYEHLFRVNGKPSVLKVLAALGKRKRVANKILCPCGCGKKLGKCEFRFTLEKWRCLDKRQWFRDYYSKFFSHKKF